MSAEIAFQNLLHDEFLRKRKKNSAFSLRAFARQLGISPASLSGFMNGKRRISFESGKKIVLKLALPLDVAKTILQSFGNEQLNNDFSYTQVDMDHYKIIADWFHFAILSLVETEGFENDPRWIANRLQITVSNARSSIKRLLRLGLIKETANSKLILTNKKFSTSDDIANLSLRKSHFQNLELAQRALEQIELMKRDYTSFTMAIDPQKLPEAKKKIRAFYKELSRTLECGKKTEVYRFCGQLFPLTTGV